MPYKTLKTIFHQTSRNSFQALEKEYQARKASPASLHFEYMVGEYPLFALHTVEVSALIEATWRLQSRIQTLWNELPGAAQAHYILALLVNEIQATNEIENIYSTRKEVVEALDAVAGITPSEKTRLGEMAMMFNGLLAGNGAPEVEFPESIAEVRELYDKLLGSEIAETDRLDGEYFRAGPVLISDGSRTIHKGVSGETNIIQRVQAMLETQSDTSSNQLVRALIGHFMFEHTHPFYDGNGRFGRFLLAMRLKGLLGAPVALNLSSEVLRQKNTYYQAFIGVENELNRAEATHFIEALLGIIVDAQEALLENLESKKSAVQRLQNELEVLAQSQHGFDEKELGIFFLLGQVHLFGPRSGVRLNEVASFLECSSQTARNPLKALEERGFVDTIQARPLVFQLSEKGCALIGLE
ncbi:putative transcriptional regulatory protein, Fic/Doc family [Corynebacterium renale]|uniref:Fic family protein n=1 Tax=Corynebacterium renale TaxID=1724 RepID=UPI000DA37BA2|nr:Fic family protein [Corynebacterium renale]SQG63651.1 putative transcriptional regulatory protein, Fic/Doc family [Corynebacterium renale]STD01367.1 putative transcriptional regulatory protein, Fic/Doc family [Corynebacterium renale]